MDCQDVIYREHALKRMFARSITVDIVKKILLDGEVIREYPDDQPFPSFLILGYSGNRPIHVVASRDGGACYVITVYEPDLTIWNQDFKTKKL